MRWVRETALWIYFLLVSVLGVIVGILRPFNPDNNVFTSALYAWGGQRALGLRVRVRGQEHLQLDSPAVMLINHQHNFDLFVVGGILPARTVCVGKSSLLWVPLFGQLFWLGGNVLINRGNRNKALAAMEATREALVTQNKVVLVFPEGTRNGGRGRLLPFKKGAFYAAVAAGAPLVMVCVSTYPKARREGRNEVLIQVLPPVPTRGMTQQDVAALLQQCQQRMGKTVQDLDRELAPA